MPWRKTQFVLLLCAFALALPGCRKRIVQAATPVIVPAAEEQTAQQPPPAKDDTASQPEPKNTTTTPASTSPKPAPNPAPRKIQPTPTPAPETPEPAAAKPPAPQISPQMSPAEQARDQQKAQENINAADQTLKKADDVNAKRPLSATEHDLVQKIQGFVTQAQEAMRGSDWLRARNLSEKAYLLSVELSKSL